MVTPTRKMPDATIVSGKAKLRNARTMAETPSDCISRRDRSLKLAFSFKS